MSRKLMSVSGLKQTIIDSAVSVTDGAKRVHVPFLAIARALCRR